MPESQALELGAGGVCSLLYSNQFAHCKTQAIRDDDDDEAESNLSPPKPRAGSDGSIQGGEGEESGAGAGSRRALPTYEGNDSLAR